jgi:hypothetical protein
MNFPIELHDIKWLYSVMVSTSDSDLNLPVIQVRSLVRPFLLRFCFLLLILHHSHHPYFFAAASVSAYFSSLSIAALPLIFSSFFLLYRCRLLHHLVTRFDCKIVVRFYLLHSGYA